MNALISSVISRKNMALHQVTGVPDDFQKILNARNAGHAYFDSQLIQIHLAVLGMFLQVKLLIRVIIIRQLTN